MRRGVAFLPAQLYVATRLLLSASDDSACASCTIVRQSLQPRHLQLHAFASSFWTLAWAVCRASLQPSARAEPCACSKGRPRWWRAPPRHSQLDSSHTCLGGAELFARVAHVEPARAPALARSHGRHRRGWRAQPLISRDRVQPCAAAPSHRGHGWCSTICRPRIARWRAQN